MSTILKKSCRKWTSQTFPKKKKKLLYKKLEIECLLKEAGSGRRNGIIKQKDFMKKENEFLKTELIK